MSVQVGRADGDLSAVTATGTTNATAAALKPGINILTAASSQTGGKLPSFAAGPIVVRTVTTACKIYPPTGGKINAVAVSTHVSVSKDKQCVFIPHPNGLDYTFLLTA